MFEAYRRLGEQREAELLREAQRVQGGQAAKRQRVRRTPSRPDPKARGAESAAPSARQ
jgi:hypothetical protein